MQFLIQAVSNSIAILVAAYLLPGIEFIGSWWQLLIAGLVLGIINSLLKPILKAIWAPLIFLTLGIFTILINISLLALTALIVPGFLISGFWPAFWGIIIISLTNYSINTIMNYK